MPEATRGATRSRVLSRAGPTRSTIWSAHLSKLLKLGTNSTTSHRVTWTCPPTCSTMIRLACAMAPMVISMAGRSDASSATHG
eukprot:scaffold117_cov40-Phaeocystis_antarctica.AAC.1